MEGSNQEAHKSGKEKEQRAKEIRRGVLKMAQNNKAADDISDETDQTMDYACLLLYYIVYILCLIISPTINASIILTAKLCMYFIIRLFWQICKCQ